MAKVNQPHARQDYCTPPELLEAVRKRFSVDLDFDAACTRENAVAPLGYCYPEVDALTQNWRDLCGLSVWCNPPFAQSGLFAAKAASSQHVTPTAARAGVAPCVFLLVQAAVDTIWWDEHVRYYARVFHLAPRPAFVGCAQGINRALALCEYGPSVTPGEERWVWKQPKNKKENGNNGNQ